MKKTAALLACSCLPAVAVAAWLTFSIQAAAAAESSTAANAGIKTFRTSDGYAEMSLDTSAAPELREWAEKKLAPALAEWYPKIVARLPGEGFEAPKQFSVILQPGEGVAATSGLRITANSKWLKRELDREAVGSLVHEMVHVVQQYGHDQPGGHHPPGWLVEGLADYIRWFQYEPQSHGADLAWLRTQRGTSLHYQAGYRVTANFLNYVVEHFDTNRTLITKLNDACRRGNYTEAVWSGLAGKSLVDLNEEWKHAVQTQLAINTLTAKEQAAGWKLLFNGTDFNGWHNFKRDDIRPGWQIKDGALVCADPHNAGDIVTTDQFGAFELELDYNISEAGNSGIMYHVTDQGGAVWATGPEFQLEDNVKAADPVRCGWLYALYQPPLDPQTGKILDATKPVGEWNHVRLVISPVKCEHFINGVKYFEYVLGSDDFNQRVAASKFSKMPGFAKSSSGFIALQGDHGQVSFRNIKIRPLAIPAAAGK